MSNYHSFGDMKFVPEVSKETFRTILESNPRHSDPNSKYRQYFDRIYPFVEREIFSLDKPFTQLGFPEQGGVTAYFSPSMTKADLDLVREFLSAKDINPLNTRAFKKPDGSYEITIGSIDQSTEEHIFKDKTFRVIKGEFAEYLKEAIYYLAKARDYAANDNQRDMITLYIESFKTGSVEKHKDSQRKWIRDLGPVVESNMGWIEVYVDPENIRAYFEGWVAVVDKEKSEKF